MPKFFARSEAFGGVVFDVPNERLYCIDAFSFDVFKAVSTGKSLADVQSAALQHFPVADHRTVSTRIEAIEKFLREDDRSPLIVRQVIGSTGLRTVPALSAPLDLYWEITRRCNVTARLLPRAVFLDTSDDVGIGDEVLEKATPCIG